MAPTGAARTAQTHSIFHVTGEAVVEGCIILGNVVVSPGKPVSRDAWCREAGQLVTSGDGFLRAAPKYISDGKRSPVALDTNVDDGMNHLPVISAARTSCWVRTQTAPKGL